MSIYSTKDYDYDLPEELIAQTPQQKRDESRLMVIHKEGGTEHRHFYDIVEYFNPGDVLVINETKVLPARLYGLREKTGAHCEILLLKQAGKDRWETLVRPGRRVKVGERLIFGDGMLTADILETTDAGGRVLEFHYEGEFYAVLDKLGQMPLPPYIHEKLEDQSRYQTVYANIAGSAAAPTAGLHFTEELLKRLQKKGIVIAKVLLHVGLGTFRPVEAEDIREHKMHSEYYEIGQDAVDKIRRAKAEGKRVVAVGTTSVRVLETAAKGKGQIQAENGWTDIFIYPGYAFKIIDALITNFHLPQSTLLMLVSAFVSRERMLEEYRQAVEMKYRFFSFGDAMLIL